MYIELYAPLLVLVLAHIWKTINFYFEQLSAHAREWKNSRPENIKIKSGGAVFSSKILLFILIGVHAMAVTLNVSEKNLKTAPYVYKFSYANLQRSSYQSIC